MTQSPHTPDSVNRNSYRHANAVGQIVPRVCRPYFPLECFVNRGLLHTRSFLNGRCAKYLPIGMSFEILRVFLMDGDVSYYPSLHPLRFCPYPPSATTPKLTATPPRPASSASRPPSPRPATPPSSSSTRKTSTRAACWPLKM